MVTTGKEKMPKIPKGWKGANGFLRKKCKYKAERKMPVRVLRSE